MTESAKGLALQDSSVRPWYSDYQKKLTTAEHALKHVKHGYRVFVGSGCGEPQHLTRTLADMIPALADLEILHILTVGKTRFAEPTFFDKCRLKSFFVAVGSREAVAEGRADYTPINLGDIPALFRSGAMSIDVALIQVSPPDIHGFCSYGLSVDIVKAGAETAKFVIAQVNPRMPMTLGDSFIHVRDIDAFVEYEEPLLEFGQPLLNPIAMDIGKHVSRLVEDGSTLRVGVGSISTAVLYALENKKDLGVHADMLTDAYLHLVNKGVITNARKSLHPGKIVTSFCLGSRELYDFVDNNPMVAFHPIDYTNNFLVISANERMVAINSGLEADLTGQVCSDSLGYEIYSGVGGAIDFFRGAMNSVKGKAIVVMPSITLDGQKSRIVPTLTEGAGVVTTRGGVQYVVTEYGVAQLHGKGIRERALALIGIAHPDFREELFKQAREMNYLRRGTIAVSSSRVIYPSEWEVKQNFGAGLEVFFRPVKATDERGLKEFFYSLPKKEWYIRFLSMMKVFPHYDVQKMVNIDYEREMTIIGLVGEKKSDRIIAVGRFVQGDHPEVAEIDFAVHPDFGRRGVASFLIQILSEFARNRRVRRLVAYISRGSEGVIGVFQSLGYATRVSYGMSAHEIQLYLDLPTQTCMLH